MKPQPTNPKENKMSNKIDWKEVSNEKPFEDQRVITIGLTKYGWTTPIPAIYRGGRFFMSLGFNSERLTQIVVETYPTHWGEEPNPPIVTLEQK